MIQVNGGQINVSVTGSPIVPRAPSTGQYFRGFTGPAYEWPCNSTPGTNSLVALTDTSRDKTYSIDFSVPATRIVMPILSLGAFAGNPGRPPAVSISVTWQFSEEFSIYSQGAHSVFGQCLQPGQCLQKDGSTLTGLEGSGIIEFSGEISALTLSVIGESENYNGFGIGIPCETNPLP
jgi:hypothetical protein